jgi:hypothetical protein
MCASCRLPQKLFRNRSELIDQPPLVATVTLGSHPALAHCDGAICRTSRARA